jgi:hypothetical protein
MKPSKTTTNRKKTSSNRMLKMKTKKKMKSKANHKKASLSVKVEGTLRSLDRKRKTLNKDGRTEGRITKMKIRCFPKEWKKLHHRRTKERTPWNKSCKRKMRWLLKNKKKTRTRNRKLMFSKAKKSPISLNSVNKKWLDPKRHKKLAT